MNSAPQAQAFARPSQTVYWVIAILLAVIATALWMRPDSGLLPAALAQNQPLAGARGVFAFTGQLDHNRFGLFMLDVDQGTIWCYEIDSSGAAQKLRLIAARTWIFDRYLQDFNCAPPDFRMVQELVAQQRGQPGQPANAGTSGKVGDPKAPPDAAPPER